MPTALPVIFLAFANSASDPLPQLNEEEKAIRKSLLARAQQHYHIHPDSHASIDSIRQYLTEYRDQVWLFHFGGHAGSKQIMLGTENAQADGVAAMLAEQSGIKLVFLNGCSTQAQVTKLLELGIPAVIATHSPIEDTIARKFAGHFYDALMAGATIGEAFQSAANFAATLGQKQPQMRNLFYEEPNDLSDLDWGLFHHPDRADVLDERLPSGMREEVPADFEPNELLIDNTFQALLKEKLFVRKKKHRQLKLRRMEILSHLPAPVAEHLRKLFAVNTDEMKAGFDKISPLRLRQLSLTYQVLMELMSFTLLAQIWEEEIEERPIKLEDSVKEQISIFLQQSATERDNFQFIPFIRSLRQALDKANIQYFVEELTQMIRLIAEDTPFRRACNHFDFLQQRLLKQNDTQLLPDIGHLCVEAEKHLAAMLAELGFLGRYTLATVKEISVRKYRHQKEASFEHKVVLLVNLQGGIEQEDKTYSSFLDSQSVVLLKKPAKSDEDDEEEEDFEDEFDVEEDEFAEQVYQEKEQFLSLSPFIIDENAFIENSDVSKLYFLHHRQSSSGAWVYRWAYKPNDPVLTVPDKKFKVVEWQIKAFLKSLKPNSQSESPA